MAFQLLAQIQRLYVHGVGIQRWSIQGGLNEARDTSVTVVARHSGGRRICRTMRHQTGAVGRLRFHANTVEIRNKYSPLVMVKTITSVMTTAKGHGFPKTREEIIIPFGMGE